MQGLHPPSITGYPFAMCFRSETCHVKPTFRRLVDNRRCVAIIEGFYEWKVDRTGLKQPYYVYSTQGVIFLAGMLSLLLLSCNVECVDSAVGQLDGRQRRYLAHVCVHDNRCVRTPAVAASSNACKCCIVQSLPILSGRVAGAFGGQSLAWTLGRQLPFVHSWLCHRAAASLWSGLQVHIHEWFMYVWLAIPQVILSESEARTWLDPTVRMQAILADPSSRHMLESKDHPALRWHPVSKKSTHW